LSSSGGRRRQNAAHLQNAGFTSTSASKRLKPSAEHPPGSCRRPEVILGGFPAVLQRLICTSPWGGNALSANAASGKRQRGIRLQRTPAARRRAQRARALRGRASNKAATLAKDVRCTPPPMPRRSGRSPVNPPACLRHVRGVLNHSGYITLKRDPSGHPGNLEIPRVLVRSMDKLASLPRAQTPASSARRVHVE